jgi:hypothetical protein
VDNLTLTLKQYLFETLGIKINFKSWDGQKELPIYLTNSFDFREGLILSQPCLFMFNFDTINPTPSNIRKFWEKISNQFSGTTIYIQQSITAYDRSRLIRQKIPFIVPGKQMYIPTIGIELREHFQTLHTDQKQHLSPAAQTVVIYALIEKMGERANPTNLAKTLGYTSMTISRAFDELSSAKIGVTYKVGKERWWSPSCTKHELWQQAKPKMRSPIQQYTWIHKKPRSMKSTFPAGLSALSHYSSLTPPTTPIYAIHHPMWINWKRRGVKQSLYEHGALFELEVWYYNPALLSDDNIVDPFSLYLSLEKTDDERVEIALEEMMRGIKW